MVSTRRLIGGFLFVLSYVLLGFGLFGALVHYEDYIVLQQSWFRGEPDEWLFNLVTDVLEVFGNRPIPVVMPVTRSLLGERDDSWSMVHVLLDKAEKGHCSYMAPYTLIFFGLVLPGIKFVGIFHWAFSPWNGKQLALNVATRLTRWTAVDAVAEAMIVALLLDGDVDAEHREGYVTFIGYCFLSAISVWIMDDSGEARGPGVLPQMTSYLCGGRPLPLCCPLVTLVPFVVVFALGTYQYSIASITVPQSAISYNLEQLAGEYQGALALVASPEEENRVIQEIGESIPLPYGEATVLEAARTLLLSGHMYTVAGSIVLFVAVFLFPVVEAIFGCVVAMKVCSGNTEYGRLVAVDSPDNGDEIVGMSHLQSHWTVWLWDASGDLAMLDVYVVGMWTAIMVLSTLGEVLIAKLLHGFYVLAPAAVLGLVHQVVCSHQCLTFSYAAAANGGKPEAKKAMSREGSREAPLKNAVPQRSARFLACCGNRHEMTKFERVGPATSMT